MAFPSDVETKSDEVAHKLSRSYAVFIGEVLSVSEDEIVRIQILEQFKGPSASHINMFNGHCGLHSLEKGDVYIFYLHGGPKTELMSPLPGFSLKKNSERADIELYELRN